MSAVRPTLTALTRISRLPSLLEKVESQKAKESTRTRSAGTVRSWNATCSSEYHLQARCPKQGGKGGKVGYANVYHAIENLFLTPEQSVPPEDLYANLDFAYFIHGESDQHLDAPKEFATRSLCTCTCGCRRRPGRRISCPGCETLVGPGCCWDSYAQ